MSNICLEGTIFNSTTTIPKINISNTRIPLHYSLTKEEAWEFNPSITCINNSPTVDFQLNNTKLQCNIIPSNNFLEVNVSVACSISKGLNFVTTTGIFILSDGRRFKVLKHG